jgi:hypothetical protein
VAIRLPDPVRFDVYCCLHDLAGLSAGGGGGDLSPPNDLASAASAACRGLDEASSFSFSEVVKPVLAYLDSDYESHASAGVAKGPLGISDNHVAMSQLRRVLVGDGSAE